MTPESTRKRWVFVFPVALLIMLLAIVVLGSNSGAANAAAPTNSSNSSITAQQASKIDVKVLQDTANGKKASFLVVLANQADTSAGSGMMRNQDAQGWYVYNALKSQADSTQGPVRAFLGARGVTYQSFWVANM